MSRRVLAAAPPPKIPSAQFVQPGQTLTGAVVDVSDRQDTDYVTRTPKIWDNGDPVMVTRIIVVATAATQNMTASDMPIEAGEPVAVWVRGKNRRAWHDALRAHGELKLAQIVQVRFAQTVRSKQGWSPRKAWEFLIREPNDGERDAGPAADALFAQINAAPAVSAAPEPDPGPRPTSDAAPAEEPPRWGPAEFDDEPF